MKLKTWKETQILLSLSDYRKFYATIAELPIGEKHSAIHNKLINLSSIYLNYDYENDTMLSQKNSEWKYSAECDAFAMSEFAKTKKMLAELDELGVPSYSNEMRVSDGETYFLAFLKMECVLRSRVLLAHSWRVEQR
jgi:TFIIF-interacting CTD phosphatase-like protein